MPPVLFPADLALVARCAQRDPEAWEVFVDRVGPRIRALARSLVGEAGADDAAAEVFLRLLERDAHVLRAYRGQAPLEAYLHVVSRRAMLEKIGSVPPPFGGGEGTLASLPDPTPGPAGRLERKEAVRAALAGLPQAQRTLLEMVYLQGLSQREAALRLGLAAGTAATWVSRSLKRLARETREMEDS